MVLVFHMQLSSCRKAYYRWIRYAQFAVNPPFESLVSHPARASVGSSPTACSSDDGGGYDVGGRRRYPSAGGPPPSTAEEALQMEEVYMDAMAFGMGCCCLQVTFQARDVSESRHLYDQLAVLSPILMALTAATPIARRSGSVSTSGATSTYCSALKSHTSFAAP